MHVVIVPNRLKKTENLTDDEFYMRIRSDLVSRKKAVKKTVGCINCVRIQN